MYSWQAIEYETFSILKRPRGRKRAGTKDVTYVQQVAAFDIETSTLEYEGEPHSFMYVWQFAINDKAYYGRSWDEFKRFLAILEERLPPKTTLLCYVFNLSFEYQYLSGQFPISLEQVFATEPRKILRLQLTPFLEMRCAAFLTNTSLRRFLQDEGVPVQKEEMDYKVIRYPWTTLTSEELSYCEADVVGLTQAIRHRMFKDGDSHYTIPFTATGYVRRDAKAVISAERRHDDYRFDSWEVYKKLIRAFRGGNTHASRFYAALGVIRHRCKGRDFASHYPFQICMCQYPSKPFQVVPAGLLTWEHYEEVLAKGYAVLMTVTFYGIELTDEREPVPYIPIDKCDYCASGEIDNGRIMKAAQLSITVTDVDMGIIDKMYTWDDVAVTWMAISTYAPLPKGYIALVRKYFDRKTTLKKKDPYMYARAKALLNALYGMMAQAVLRMEIKMDENGMLYEEKPEDMQAAYEKNAKRCFLPYSAGVWVTSHARAMLQEAIWAVGYERFIYCDTDSVKFLDEGEDPDWEAIFPGDEHVALDSQGKEHRMGTAELDAVYDEFVTLGAKKYAVVYADDPVNGDHAGMLEITVAGVDKEEGSKELVRKGGLQAFKPGLIFESGGLDARYNDFDDFSLMVGKTQVEISRNVSLVDGVYSMGLSDTYSALLESIRDDRRIIDPFSID